MVISDIAIRRPVATWMLMVGLIVLGTISFKRMGISQFPDVDFPVVSVNLRYEGAAPQVIETEVVDIVENALMSVPGVQNISSNSQNSEGTVSVEFNFGRNIDLAVAEVQTKLAQIQNRLPKGVSPARVTKVNPDDQPIIFASLTSTNHSRRELMEYVSDHLKSELAMIYGVGDLTLNGYSDPQLRIWVSPEKLTSYDFTINDVIHLLQTSNKESPGGYFDREQKRTFIRTLGEVNDISDFAKLPFNTRNGRPVYNSQLVLGQVARIENGLEDTLRTSRANGVFGVSIGILKQRGSNAVEVARAIREKVEAIKATLPSGMNLAINFDSSLFVEQAVQELNFTLLLSALLTALVCLVFLGSFSSLLNVLFAIPTSIIGSFIVLYFMGFTLNTFTLLGLSLSVGIVVDDAIMVLENIMRHKEKGESKKNSALLGAREITFAAIAATFSIIAIFLPVAFMKGVIGKFFFQFGVTITVAVLLSLLEALTLTPMRCSQFGAEHNTHTSYGKIIEQVMAKASAHYRNSLRFVLRFRYVVIFVATLLFAVSLFFTLRLKQEFLPPEDQGRFVLRMKTKTGSTLDFTDKKVAEIEKILASKNEIFRFVTSVGGGSFGDSNKGFAFITMKERGQRGIDPILGREMSQLDLMNWARKELSKVDGIKVGVQDLSTRGFVASRGMPVEFAIQGPEWDKLGEISGAMVKELEKTSMLYDIDSDFQVGMPELHLIPNRKKAIKRGVDIADIDATITTLLGGVLVGSYTKDGHRYDIHLKIEAFKQDPKNLLKKIYVRNNRGERISLGELVSIEDSSEPIGITRKNRERAITIAANLKNGASQKQALLEVQKIAAKILPPGYHLLFTGSSEAFSQAFASLLFALLLGIFVAYMILASQFNSFFDPFTVLVALPLSLTGASAALYLMGQSINIYSMIGFILLMGIVKKNSILLVDFTNQVRSEKKLGVQAALLHACPIRLRPIIMTSIATVVGAIPAALALGPGAESRIPMADAVIGGVVASTILTLYVVPCVYSVLARR